MEAKDIDKCPTCKSKNIVHDAAPGPVAGGIPVSVTCLDCDDIWIDTYVFDSRVPLHRLEE